MKLMSNLRVDEISKFEYVPTTDALQTRGIGHTFARCYTVHSIDKNGVKLNDPTEQISSFCWQPNELIALDIKMTEEIYKFEILQTCQTLQNSCARTPTTFEPMNCLQFIGLRGGMNCTISFSIL